MGDEQPEPAQAPPAPTTGTPVREEDDDRATPTLDPPYGWQ